MNQIEHLIQEHLVASVKECFSTTLSVNLEDSDQLGYPNDEHNMICSVGFTGNIEGNVSIIMSGRQACLVVGQMLGMEFPEVNADVKDGFGEVGNLVAGGLRNRMTTSGHSCNIAVPTTIEGKGIKLTFPSEVVLVKRHFQGPNTAFDVIVDYKKHQEVPAGSVPGTKAGLRERAMQRFKALFGNKQDNNIGNDI